MDRSADATLARVLLAAQIYLLQACSPGCIRYILPANLILTPATVRCTEARGASQDQKGSEQLPGSKGVALQAALGTCRCTNAHHVLCTPPGLVLKIVSLKEGEHVADRSLPSRLLAHHHHHLVDKSIWILVIPSTPLRGSPVDTVGLVGPTSPPVFARCASPLEAGFDTGGAGSWADQ